MARFLIALALVSLARAEEPLFEVGAYCNVSSRDFLDPDFGSNHSVAGPGCPGPDGATGCYCAPVLSNNVSLSDWTWQCGDNVQFGPKTNKTCPAEVPVRKVVANVTDTSVESMLGAGVYCNLTLHPGGRFDDESCSYSTCAEGGDYSAVCACVDLEGRGVAGGGQQWFCLHSKCGCGDGVDHSGHDHEGSGKSGASSRFMMTATVASLVVALL